MNSILICAFSMFSILAISDVIKVGVANFPPYSISENGQISGAEVEIIEESLKRTGHSVELVSYPYGRLTQAFKSKKVDATIVTMKTFEGYDVHYSDIVFPYYQTVAIHLKENNFSINKILDLKGKSISAHQRASDYYGPNYVEVIKSSPKKYSETANQETQVPMLFLKRIDVIVLAHEIFLYYKRHSKFKNTDKEFVVSKVFGENFGFHNVFWNSKVRDDFNKGLKQIKADGTYDKIAQKYLEKHPKSKMKIGRRPTLYVGPIRPF